MPGYYDYECGDYDPDEWAERVDAFADPDEWAERVDAFADLVGTVHSDVPVGTIRAICRALLVAQRMC